jgi:ABC-type glycerol-3-phosphate transport system substrate-binding protein
VLHIRFLHWASLILICGTFCLIQGCDSFNDNIPEGRIVIQFWHGMGGPLGKVLNALIDEYNEVQTTYFVKGISMGSYDTLQKKILASVVANRSPDISQNFEALTLKLSRAGKIVCLEELIAREPNPSHFKDDIIPVMLANNTFEGKLWSFPFNKSVPVLYYNRDMFQRFGLDPDKPPRTIEELKSYARILTRDTDDDGETDIYGFAFTMRNQWNWACRVLSYGGRLYIPETNSVDLINPASMKATRSYSDMLVEGTAKFAAGYDHQNNWLAGKVAMFEASIVSKVYLREKIRFDHGVAPVPYGDNPAVLLSGTNINIFDNGDPQRIEGSWDFIKWFTSTEIGARWSLNSTYMPVRKSSLQTQAMLEAFENDPNFAAPYEQIEHATFDPRISEWFECRVRIADELEQVYIKATETREKNKGNEYYLETLDHHLNEMQKTVNRILSSSLENKIWNVE